jgi:hypothetical protein
VGQGCQRQHTAFPVVVILEYHPDVFDRYDHQNGPQ